MYKPLLDSLTIKSSGIDGLGLFAREDIKAGTYMGVTHVWEQNRDTYIRTPLGGFINHSNNPNCVKAVLRFTDEDDPKLKINYMKWNLIVIDDIQEGEELTVKYTFYKI